MEMRDPTDEELLARAGADVEAFAALYRRHSRLLLGYCVRRLEDPELAADTVAEVFAVALRAALRGERPESVARWLYGIARNKAADAQRRGRAEDRARRRLGIGRIELSDEGAERVLALSDVEILRVELDRLPADERDAVEARMLDDRPYVEIAAAAGVTPAAARQRVSRGLARLRTRLEG